MKIENKTEVYAKARAYMKAKNMKKSNANFKKALKKVLADEYKKKGDK